MLRGGEGRRERGRGVSADILRSTRIPPSSACKHGVFDLVQYTHKPGAQNFFKELI